MSAVIPQTPYRTVFSAKNNPTSAAKTTVIVPVYNYEQTIIAALTSVAAQTVDGLSLVVIDDASTDGSLSQCENWMQQHSARFADINLVAHQQNAGLSHARNTGFALCNTEFGFTLDADNLLYPRCIARCEQALTAKTAAFAYPTLETFGGEQGLRNTQLWSRARLARGNYIDAMALIRKSAWAEVGGYVPFEHGWEDFDLWCSFAQNGWHGVRVPEILARYRVHHASMLQSKTNRTHVLRKTAKALKRRHSWLNLQH